MKPTPNWVKYWYNVINLIKSAINNYDFGITNCIQAFGNNMNAAYGTHINFQYQGTMGERKSIFLLL